MGRKYAAAVGGIAVVVFALAGCGGGSNEASSTTESTTAQTTTSTTGSSQASAVLKATVGPGFDISLTTEDGAAVTTLPAGSYTLLTDDKSDAHNFHLTGPGVDVKTDVSGTGTDSFDVELQAGSYHFQCDPHASSMNGDFQVTG